MKIKTVILLALIGACLIGMTYAGTIDGTGLVIGVAFIGFAVLGLLGKLVGTAIKLAVLAAIIVLAYMYLR